MDAAALTARRGARAARVRRARRARDRGRRAGRLGSATLLGGRGCPSGTDDGPETATPAGAAPEMRGRRERRDGRRRPLERADRRARRRRGLAADRAARRQGRIALLADTSPLQNRLLDEADNAALALALGGRGPLTFVESVHGYGPARGLAAVPARFGWALIGLLLAALVFMFARGRRLGPPERERRELPPPRRAYVDSLAATMARGKAREEAVAPVRAEARGRLARRAGLREERRRRRGARRRAAPDSTTMRRAR